MTPSTPAPTDAGALADLPTIPDDDSDFTPDLARKIIAKYQELLRNSAPQETLTEVNCPHCDSWFVPTITEPASPQEPTVDEITARSPGVSKATIRNLLDAESASPQETRGDEPVVWSDEAYQKARDCMIGLLRGHGWTIAEGAHGVGEFDNAFQHAVGILSLNAASQQSPRLEREGLKKAAESLEFIRLQLIGNLEEPERSAFWRANAIRALLSPGTTVVPSTEQVWQPADTAPHDGSTIEVRFLTDNPRRVLWSQSDRGTYWHLADSNGPAIINFNPTEWRPLSSKNRGAE